MAPRGGMLLVYLYKAKHDSVPTLTEVSNLRPEDAARRLRIGDLGLINGEWTLIGNLPSWEKGAWRMPSFVRRDELTGRLWRIDYTDSDPQKIEREQLLASDAEGLENDGLYGYGAIEILMTQLAER